MAGFTESYGNWNAIYRRFSRWCDVGVFQALHEHFHDAGAISGILIERSCGHMPRQRGPQKKGGQEAQALGRTFTTKLNLSLSDACHSVEFYFDSGTPQ